MSGKTRIRAKDRDAILQALRAGVTPPRGLQHIQVGRAAEVKQMVLDATRVTDEGGAFRLIIGEYGAGKTFFLTLTQAIALEKNLVVMQADLAPDRRIHATAGQAVNLFNELTKNAATRTVPANALPNIVERFFQDIERTCEDEGLTAERAISRSLQPLLDLNGGFELKDLLVVYYDAFQQRNEDKMGDCLRWLRGEFNTKTEAKKALGVGAIVTDKDVYDQLKLYSRFVRVAGYGGLLVTLDEMVNLFKLQSAAARKSNYEQILRILNDVLQGRAEGLWVLLGGTPEFLMDSRRGLYSYEALHSRLSENQFATDGLIDLSGPVIRLQSLEQEELFVLLQNIRNVHFSGDDEGAVNVPNDAIVAYMNHCSNRIGDNYFRTPRTVLRSWIHLLSILEQNPGTKWSDLVEGMDIQPDVEDQIDEIVDDIASSEGEDELSSLRL